MNELFYLRLLATVPVCAFLLPVLLMVKNTESKAVIFGMQIALLGVQIVSAIVYWGSI